MTHIENDGRNENGRMATPECISIHLTIFLRLKDEVFPFQNNPKNLDLSYKTDLDLWVCFSKISLD